MDMSSGQAALVDTPTGTTLSIVIPVFNEEGSIPSLHARLIEELDSLSRPFEIIFVNDGSIDATERRLEEIVRRDPRVKVINFKRNFGQTAAMMAGIDFAQGEIIVPMDGDLQNDPADIPRLLAKLDEGYDVVSGWRKDRQDHKVRRNFLSRLANSMISTISGVRLHDYGCTLKAYRRDVIKDIRLYGEMHRFVPIYATWSGARVVEIPVTHHPRVHGVSKYGLNRVFKVLLDLIVVEFLARYACKPIYIFGGFGLICMLVAILAGSYAVYLKLFEGLSFILTPLPLLTVMASITGVMSVLMGLLAELIMRTYYESQGKPTYLVRSTLNIAARTP
jgi:glycosyltransferase involved in cell wall biosynthesis